MRDGRPTAIKVLHKFLCTSKEILKRFKLEAELVAKLRHPSLVEVFEYGELATAQPYIAMEWVEGRTLEEELRVRGPFSPAETLVVLEELASALTLVHGHGIVHRDIKSQNIVCIPAKDWFHVKLVDFGIAKMIDPEVRSELTTTGKLLGTPNNMSPEQIQGSRDVDLRADVYALGLLAFQLVVGRPAFVGASAVEVEELHLSAPPPRPSSLAPVSTAFDDVIAKCLKKDRHERYASVAEMIVDLRAAVAKEKAAPRVAIGVRAEISIDPSIDDPGDDVYDDIDEVVEEIRAGLGDAGLVLAAFASRLVIGTADDAPGARDRIAAATAALVSRLSARPSASPHVRVGFTLHAHTDLGRVAGWPEGPEVGVRATPAFTDRAS
jgi:serine/threonine-protein kinase